MNKGMYGYIGWRRKVQALFLFAVILAAGIIFIIGLLCNKMSPQNIFSVLAALFILPGAHFLTQLLLLIPYRSPDKEKYEQLQTLMTGEMVLFSDLVLTSPEHVMNLDFAVLNKDRLIVLTGGRKQDTAYLKEYLTKTLTNWGNGQTLHFWENYDAFLQDVKKEAKKEENVKKETKKAGNGKKEDSAAAIQAVSDYLLSQVV